MDDDSTQKEKTKANRKAIPQSVRFEVFKRDMFRCQYCGRGAPDVVLQVDHMHPVYEGGSNEILNLITSCFDCNSGKGKRLISDQSILDRQRAQIEELEERRQQLEMMLAWRNGLADLHNQAIDGLREFFEKLVPGVKLNERGVQSLRRMVADFGLHASCAALENALPALRYNDSGKIEMYSVGVMLAAAYIECQPPEIRKLYKIRNRVCAVARDPDKVRAIAVLRRALRAGYSPETLEEFSNEILSERLIPFARWMREMEELCEGGEEP